MAISYVPIIVIITAPDRNIITTTVCVNAIVALAAQVLTCITAAITVAMISLDASARHSCDCHESQHTVSVCHDSGFALSLGAVPRRWPPGPQTPPPQAKKCVNLSSYNYLGFGGVDKFCTPAARKAALEHGFSASGTRTEGGTLPLHRELEREVAKFLQKEDALVLGMGFATNSTILPALFEAGGKGILVLSDGLNHRSIVEGVRLSGAAVRAFTHNSMTDLEAQLKRAVEEGQPGGGEPWRKVFVVVEGIYSMEGDFCRLREIVTLKNRYKAFLYLDEAHSIGAVGPNGRGVTELFGVPTSEAGCDARH